MNEPTAGYLCSGAGYHLPTCDGTCGEINDAAYVPGQEERLDTAHDVAVEIEHALRWRGMVRPSGEFQIEPPDSEELPASFGLSVNGELRWIVSVEPW